MRCASCTEPAESYLRGRPVCREHFVWVGAPDEATALLQVEFLQADRERQRRLTAELRNDFPAFARYVLTEMGTQETRADAALLRAAGIKP